MWNWCKAWLAEQWNENSSVIGPHTYMDNWFLTNCESNSEKKMTLFSTNDVGTIGYANEKDTLIHIEHHMKGKERDSPLRVSKTNYFCQQFDFILVKFILDCDLQKWSLSLFRFPIYLSWSDGTKCHDLKFLNVEF